MKTVQDKDGNVIKVAEDTMCHAAKNGALPIMLDAVLDAAVFTKMKEKAVVAAEKKAAYITGSDYKEQRRKDYNKRGATVEVLTVLLWKKEMGEEVQDDIDAIQTLRAEVEAKYPEPQ